MQQNVATAEQDHIEVEDQEDPMDNQIPEQSDDSDDELQFSDTNDSRQF